MASAGGRVKQDGAHSGSGFFNHSFTSSARSPAILVSALQVVSPPPFSLKSKPATSLPPSIRLPRIDIHLSPLQLPPPGAKTSTTSICSCCPLNPAGPLSTTTTLPFDWRTISDTNLSFQAQSSWSRIPTERVLENGMLGPMAIVSAAIATLKKAEQSSKTILARTIIRTIGPFPRNYLTHPHRMTTPAAAIPKPNCICPLCGGPNGCAPAQTGSFDTPCWCHDVKFDSAALEKIPATQRYEACICRHCATSDADN
ncbi:MAG: hypothetical protein JWN23_2305 [Rhodocyclales bacterium]|nr:hypothetical protein [Rhodocyclales bacterium]